MTSDLLLRSASHDAGHRIACWLPCGPRPWIARSWRDAREGPAGHWPSAPGRSSRQQGGVDSPKAGSTSWTWPVGRRYRRRRVGRCAATARGRTPHAGKLAALTGALPIAARGATMASVLLSDGTGPLHNHRSPLDLGAAVREATRQIDPSADAPTGGADRVARGVTGEPLHHRGAVSPRPPAWKPLPARCGRGACMRASAQLMQCVLTFRRTAMSAIRGQGS